MLGEELPENINGGGCDLPVGDSEISEMGTGVTGKACPGVEAGAAELASHYAEGRGIEVGN